MENLIFFVCSLVGIIGIKSEKKYLNPITVLFLLWGVVTKLSSIRLYNLKGTDDSTYLLIAIGLVSYGIGYYTLKFLYRSFKSSRTLKNKVKLKYLKVYTVNYKLLYFLSAISIIFYLKDLIIISS